MKQLPLLQAHVRAIVKRYWGKRPIGVCPRCGRAIYRCFRQHDEECPKAVYGRRDGSQLP